MFFFGESDQIHTWHKWNEINAINIDFKAYLFCHKFNNNLNIVIYKIVCQQTLKQTQLTSKTITRIILLGKDIKRIMHAFLWHFKKSTCYQYKTIVFIHWLIISHAYVLIPASIKPFLIMYNIKMLKSNCINMFMCIAQ